MRKRILSIILTLCMLTGLCQFSIPVSAEDLVISMDNNALPSGTDSISFNVSGAPSGGWLGIFPEALTTYASGEYADWYNNTDISDGVITFPSGVADRMQYKNWPLDDGRWKLVVFSDGGYSNVAGTYSFTVGEVVETAPSFSTEKTTFTAGESITFTYANSTSATDWIAIYSDGGFGNQYVDWAYTPDGNGTVVFSVENGDTWVNTPGTYDIKYYYNNGYELLGEMSIVIEEPIELEPEVPNVVIYVATTGDDTADGLTAETAVATIAKAIELIGAENDGTVVLVDSMAFADAAHTGKITYESADENAKITSAISLNGPSVINAHISGLKGLTTNGYYIELGGAVDTANGINELNFNSEGLDEELVMNGKYISALRSQTSGNVNITLNGGTLRLLSSYAATTNINITVNSGEHWVNNHIDAGPVTVNGAYQAVYNAGTHTTPGNTFGSSVVDWSGGKITYSGGKWVVKSTDTENFLAATSTPGKFAVTGEKTAYYQNDATVYYSVDGYITLPAGTVNVSWTDGDVKSVITDPATVSGQEFNGWEDDGKGTLTAKFISAAERLDYYVMLGGTGSGVSADAPAGSISDIVKKINADGHTAEDTVTVHVIKSTEPSYNEGDKIAAADFSFLYFTHSVGHTATIRYTTYDYANTGALAAVALYTSVPSGNNGTYIQGPTIIEDLVILDCWPTYRTDINVQGHDFEAINMVRRRLTGSDPYTVSKNSATKIGSGSNRSGFGNVGEGGRIIIHDASQFATISFGGYVDNANQDTSFDNDHTYELNNASGKSVDLSTSASGVALSYNKNVNLVLNKSTDISFVRTSDAVVKGAIQVVLNNGSTLKSMTASAPVSTSEGAANAPVYIMDSGSNSGSLDVTETAGTFAVNADGLYAYAQIDGENTVYYGKETLTVAKAGTYTVNYAESVEAIIAALGELKGDPATGLVFTGWQDDGNGVLTSAVVQKQPETLNIYVKYGGTGDGLSADAPVATVYDAVTVANAKGLIYGDTANIYIIQSDDWNYGAGELLVGKINGTTTHPAHHITAWVTGGGRVPAHYATIHVQSYDVENPSYLAATGYLGHNMRMSMNGPTVFTDIILVDMRSAYRGISANGYDVTYGEGTVFACIPNDEHAGTAKAWDGTINQSGVVNADIGEEYVKSGGPGGTVTFLNAFTANYSGRGVHLPSATAAPYAFTDDVNIVFDNANIETNLYFADSSGQTTIGGDLNIVIKNAKTITAQTRAGTIAVSGAVQNISAYGAPVISIPSNVTAGSGIWNISVESADITLAVTDTAGTYTVSGGKVAYAVSDDGRTVYYGSSTLTLPSGTWKIYAAESVEAIIASLTEPTHTVFVSFEGWDTTVDGVITAKLIDVPDAKAVYYVKYGGTGNGLTAETPVGTVAEAVALINDCGYVAGDEVTIYIINDDTLTTFEKDGDGNDITEFYKYDADGNYIIGVNVYATNTVGRFTPWNTNGGSVEAHAATIIVKGYADGTYLSQSNKIGYNTTITLNGPTVFEDIILVTDRRHDRELFVNGYDVTFNNCEFWYQEADNSSNSVAYSGLLKGHTRIMMSGSGSTAAGGGGTIRVNAVIPDKGGSTYGMQIAGDKANTFTNNVKLYIDHADNNGGNIVWGGAASTFSNGLSIILNAGSVTNVAKENIITVNNGLQIVSNNGTTYPALPSVVEADEIWYINSADTSGNSIDVTDVSGTFTVVGGKYAYAQSADKRTVYYGNETLTLPAGTYAISYADTLEAIAANAARPADIDEYNLFDSFVDNGDGTMTAKFVYTIPTYYVSASGSDENDGLTPETPFATTGKAIDAINDQELNGVIYVIGAVTLNNKAHATKIYYESYNGGTLVGASNKIALMGPTAINADFAAIQNITTNGYYLELGGTVDSTNYVNVTVGNLNNETGADETVAINGKFVNKLVTRVSGQTTGEVYINVNGGILRQVSTGSGSSGDTSYIVDGVHITVKSGEFWCLNHTDATNHKATGAFEYVANGGNYYFPDGRQLLSSVRITEWTDYTPNGADGFVKIQFNEGKWVIRSADEDNFLYTTETPGTYKYEGEKTPYYITENTQSVYYGKDGYITLPTGTIDVLWIDEFSAEAMPDPTLDPGFEFGGWTDDGEGILTAIVINPNFFYVDAETGSDDSLGTETAPFATVSKAMEALMGKNGYIYVITSASLDDISETEFEGHVTISGTTDAAVLSLGGDVTVSGNLKLENITLENGEYDILAGARFEIGANVTLPDGTVSSVGTVNAGTKLVLNNGTYVVSTKNGEVVLNDSEASVTVSDGNAKISAENSEIISVVSAVTGGTLAIVSNGKKLSEDASPEHDNAWYISSEATDGSRVDYTETKGTFGIKAVYGKTPVAVSEDGTVYVAGDYISEDIAPATWYDMNDYTDYINYRKPLSNTYKKLTVDKELDVLYFGGSVTNGTGSSNASKYSWRALIGEWLNTSFPDATITHTNRASGESGTYLGTYRVQRDVIAHKPDLIFLEYSINDKYYGSTYENAGRQYETIVREIKQALPECDIVTILVSDTGTFNVNRQGQLHTQAQAHEDMAIAYNIPTIWAGPALVNKLEGTTYDQWRADWSNYATDIVHLNDAGNYEYYLPIREFMHNSLFCTDHSGRLLRNDELPAVVSTALFDGNRTLTQPTAALLTRSEELGGTGFSFNSGFYGIHDYYGYFTASSADAILAFEVDGTDVALYSNYYSDHSMLISIDGGEYTTIKGSSHAPARIAEGLSSGKHIIRIKPQSGTINIAAILTRDTTKATVQGTTFTYTDYSNHTLTVPAGSYNMQYLTVNTVADIPFTAKENQIFLGWQDSEGVDIALGTAVTPGMVLVPRYVDVNDYVSFAGVQIRVASGETKQGLRFVADKLDSIDEVTTVKNYGMVVIPSEIIGDGRAYTDYDPAVENCTINIVGAEELYSGSTHEYNGSSYSSAEVEAVNIFAELEGGVRYTTCITDITDYARYYTLKAYVRYTYNGVDYVAYTTPFRSSIYEVAKAAQSSENEAEKTVADSIVESVEGAEG